MSTTYISAGLRRQVSARAENLCEYCLIHENDTFFGCEVDHIISEKHQGRTQADNLVLACLPCNRNKGSDIATLLLPETGILIRFFHPRTDKWQEHFQLSSDGITIAALTDIGSATIRIFGFNDSERLLERRALQSAGRYPTAAALRTIRGEI